MVSEVQTLIEGKVSGILAFATGHFENDRANFRLMAAAPELLTALKKCLEDDAGDLDLKTVDLAMEAIKKAEGRK